MAEFPCCLGGVVKNGVRTLTPEVTAALMDEFQPANMRKFAEIQRLMHKLIFPNAIPFEPVSKMKREGSFKE